MRLGIFFYLVKRLTENLHRDTIVRIEGKSFFIHKRALESIHKNLRQLGFRGCTVYECFGAGQKVAQVTFDGHDWRQTPGSAKQMFEVFPIMRQLHELLWYLTGALMLQSARPIHGALRDALDETERLTYLSPDALMNLDVAAHRADVNDLLLRTSELVRAEAIRQQGSTRGRQKSYGRGQISSVPNFGVLT
jgi:uncharacterized protein YjbI with pentapeptide repeats